MLAASSDLPSQFVGSCGIPWADLFRDAGVAVLLLNPVVQDCNPAALKLFRATRDQILGRSLQDLSLQQNGSSAVAHEHSRRAALGETPRYAWSFVRPDGTSFQAGVTLSRVGDPGSEYQLAIVALSSDGAETEELLTRRTAQLESVTAELDAFAWSVSHDLRAAIAGIAACSRIVIHDFGDGLNEEARRWLEHIHGDALQLDKFTEALLVLSRLSRKPLHPVDLDLSSMAREIAGKLAACCPDRSMDFQAGDGLSACGDPVLIRTLLENLLDNAWKFTGRIASGRVEFGCLRTESSDNRNQTVFYVRDNGAGFDMAQVDRLFVAFQRLHRDPDLPGNGMGLATVRRIAHRHGGKAWAESAPGAGATFFFTLGGRLA